MVTMWILARFEALASILSDMAKRARSEFSSLNLFVGETPPTEFRIFAAGVNTSLKGPVVFDAAAAKKVMAAYEAHGVDVMIDLEHLSLFKESQSYDPDARGWCKLEVRNGGLWAVDVTWTPEGAKRLADKTQRYISPVFLWDGDSDRVAEIFNIAITALPATDNIAPLVAASRVQFNAYGDIPMTPEQFAAIAEALGLGADANVEDVVATISAMVKKITDAANGDGDAEDKAEPAEGTPAAAAPPVMAASRLRVGLGALSRLSGKKDIGSILVEVEVWRKSHVDLETQRVKLAAERAALDGGERRRLVGELVRLGTEIPATAWSDDTATTPAEPWASMALDSLRARVEKVTAAKGTKAPGPKPKTPADETGGQAVTVRGEVVQLSRSEVDACKDAGAKPEDYASNKLIRLKAQGAR